MADGLIDLGVDVRVPFGILFFVFGNRECLLHAESSTTGLLRQMIEASIARRSFVKIRGEYIFCLL